MHAIVIKQLHFEVANTVHLFLVQHPDCSDLIYLILLAAVHSLWIRRRPQPELRIAEVSISVDIMQAFPDDLLLREETLVCNQEVQLTLEKQDTLHVTTPRQLFLSWYFVWKSQVARTALFTLATTEYYPKLKYATPLPLL